MWDNLVDTHFKTADAFHRCALRTVSLHFRNLTLLSNYISSVSQKSTWVLNFLKSHSVFNLRVPK